MWPLNRSHSLFFVDLGYFSLILYPYILLFSLHFLSSLFFLFHLWYSLLSLLFSFPTLLNSFLSEMEAKRVHLVYFVEVMTDDTFMNRFSVLALAVRHFLNCVIEKDVTFAKSIKQMMEKNSDSRSKALKKPMFARYRDSVLKEIRAKEVRRIARP